MEKYKFENNKAVVDQPSIITISSTSVSIEHAGSTDTASIPDDANLTIQIGNIESYNPTEIEQEPVPEVTPNPSEGGSSGGQQGGGESGGDNEGGNSGSQEGGGDNPDTPINPDPTPSGNGNITIKVNNRTGGEIRLCGEVIMNISRHPLDTSWSDVKTLQVDFVNPHSHGWANETNDRVIANGSYTTWTCSVDSQYLDGTYGIMQCSTNNEYGVPLYLYCKYYNKEKGTVSQGNGMYHTVVNSRQILQSGATIEVTVDRLKLKNGSSGPTDSMVATSSTTTSNIPSDIKYVILLPGKLTL